jgi:uncharacterized RDD family membrane protein YckC
MPKFAKHFRYWAWSPRSKSVPLEPIQARAVVFFFVMSDFLNQLQAGSPVLSQLDATNAAMVCTETEVLFLNASGLQRAPLLEVSKVNREGGELVISSNTTELIRGAIDTDKESLSQFFTVVQAAGKRAHLRAAEARAAVVPERVIPAQDMTPQTVTPPPEVVPVAPRADSFHADVQQAAPVSKMSPVDFSMSRPATATENAGFWFRALAAIIDFILVSVISSIVSGLFGFNAALVRFNEISRNLSVGGSSDGIQQEALSLVPPILLTMIFSLLLSWLYFALLESSKQQATLGKMALGLKVTNLSGQAIGFGRATWRYFAKQIPGLVALIIFSLSIIPLVPVLVNPGSAAAQGAAGGFLLIMLVAFLVSVVPFLMAGFTAQKQALHDILAKTLVVKNKR